MLSKTTKEHNGSHMTAGKLWTSTGLSDAQLYNEAFTGHAKAIRRCQYYDHDQSACPTNPHRSFAPYLGVIASYGYYPSVIQPPQTLAQEICERFNEGRCGKQQRCNFVHLCSALIQCPRRLLHTALTLPSAGVHPCPAVAANR